MSTTVSLPPIEVLESAAHTLAEQARTAKDTGRENAINKAQMQLAAGTVPVAVYGAFLVESRTNPGIVYRVSHVYGCGCQAGQSGKACWHSALIAIVETAQARALPQRIAKSRVQIDAETAELFA